MPGATGVVPGRDRRRTADHGPLPDVRPGRAAGTVGACPLAGPGLGRRGGAHVPAWVAPNSARGRDPASPRGGEHGMATVDRRVAAKIARLKGVRNAVRDRAEILADRARRLLAPHRATGTAK